MQKNSSLILYQSFGVKIWMRCINSSSKSSSKPSSSSQAATQVIKVWWFARMPLYRQYYYLCRYNPDTGCQIAGLGLQNYR
jgi:hypothetical protein